MQNRWKLTIYTVVAYAAYIISMIFIPKILTDFFGDWPLRIGTRLSRQFTDTSLLYFCTAHMAVFGALIPLYIAYKFKLKPHRRVAPKIIIPCATLLILTFFFYSWQQGFLYNMLHPNPDPAYMVEAFFYIFPFTLGLCVFSCYLIPRTVMYILNGHSISPLAEALSAAASMMLSWTFYIGSAHILPEKIFWPGLAIAAAGALSRSFYLSFIVCFSALYGASMVHPVFYSIPWQPILPGFLVACCAFCLYISSRDNRAFPPLAYYNS